MFKNIRLGSLAGVPIQLHWTLVIGFGYIIGLAFANHGWFEGIQLGVLLTGIFASITAHEYGHVFAARKYGIKTLKILLTPIGGMALMNKAADNPNHQIIVSAAGPLVSILLLIFFVLLDLIILVGTGHKNTIVNTLVAVNFILFAFNMLPIYPLDGGQIMHALIKKFFKRDKADWFTLRFSQCCALLMAGWGCWFSHYSLILIAAFVFMIASVHFDSPWTLKLFGSNKKQTITPESRFIDEHRR